MIYRAQKICAETLVTVDPQTSCEGVDAEEIKCSTKVKNCFNNQPASTNSHVTSADLPILSV